MRGQDNGAADRVAFVRHGGRAAAAGKGGFLDFGNFGARQMLDISRHFGQRAQQPGQPRPQRRLPAAERVPGQRWGMQVQDCGKCVDLGRAAGIGADGSTQRGD